MSRLAELEDLNTNLEGEVAQLMNDRADKEQMVSLQQCEYRMGQEIP